MSVPDGAPQKIIGAELQAQFSARLAGANPFLVGNTTPGNAVAMMGPSAVNLGIPEAADQKQTFQPPPLVPPKLTVA
jgi:hypothetical protein